MCSYNLCFRREWGNKCNKNC